MKINDSNYYVVHGWMISELGLKGIDLQVFAILYGFTQDGETQFTGSTQYLCEFCGGVSRPTVINAIKRLTDAGLIVKTVDVINGVSFNRYKVSLDHVKNFYGGCKEILQGGCKEILHNKEDIDKEVHKEDISLEFERLWSLYPRKEGKKQALAAYQRARKSGVQYTDVERGIKSYAQKVRAENTETRYVKMGSTYFSGECWNDVYESQPDREYGETDPVINEPDGIHISRKARRKKS